MQDDDLHPRTDLPVLVLDFDGVLRLFPGQAKLAACLEQQLGMSPGDFSRALYDAAAFDDLLVGRISAGQWREAARERVGRVPAQAWFGRPSTIDERVLAIIDDERQGGRRVVLLSNGTNELRSDLTRLGLADRFDCVYNSAELGLAKPDAAVYRAVARAEGRRPTELLFVDDNKDNVAGASRLGWSAARYTGPSDLKHFVRRAGPGDGQLSP